MDKLGMNATEMQKIETIFDLIKINGKLGIEYDASERMPKTPNQVLKDKKGDCDELSLTFLAVAEKAGISIKNFNLLVITFEMKTTSEIKKESREESKKEPKEYSFHAAVLTSGDEIYLLDPAMPKVGIVKLKEMNEKSLNNVYSGKEILGGKKIVGVNSFNIKEGRHEILSTYYEEGADYYHNRNKPFFAMKYYKKALKLNSNNKTLKEKAAINYVYTAVNNITDKKKQEELFRKAIELYPEYAEANFRLGTLLSSQKRYKEAIVFFEKAITLLEKVTEPKPWHLMARSNLAICFYSLKKYREAKERYLEIIKLTNKKLKANPRNIMLLEHSCKANLNLVAIYYNKEKNSEKAKYHNSKAFQYAERGIKLSREGSKEHKLFLKIKEKTQLNFKLFH